MPQIHVSQTVRRRHQAIYQAGRLLNQLAFRDQRAWLAGQWLDEGYRVDVDTKLNRLTNQFTTNPEARFLLQEAVRWRQPEWQSQEQRLAALEFASEEWLELNRRCRAAFTAGSSVVAVLEGRRWLSEANELAFEYWGKLEFRRELRNQFDNANDNFEARLFALAVEIDGLLHPVPITDAIDWSWRPAADADSCVPPLIEDWSSRLLDVSQRQRILDECRDLGFAVPDGIRLEHDVVRRGEFAAAVDEIVLTAFQEAEPHLAETEPAVPLPTDVPVDLAEAVEFHSPTCNDGKSSKRKILEREARTQLRTMMEQGHAYSSHRELADRIGCSSSTICKAIKRDPELLEWSKRPPRDRLGHLTLDESRVLDPHSAIPDILDDSLVESTFNFLLKEAKSTERNEMLEKSPVERRELAKAYLEEHDPKLQRQIREKVLASA